MYSLQYNHKCQTTFVFLTPVTVILQHIKIVTIQWQKDWCGWKFIMISHMVFTSKMNVFRSISVDYIFCQKSSPELLQFSWNGCFYLDIMLGSLLITVSETMLGSCPRALVPSFRVWALIRAVPSHASCKQLMKVASNDVAAVLSF